MIALACVAVSALCFYLAFGFEALWPLQWVAPIPVLWFAFARANGWQTFTVAAGAYALGGFYLVQAYASIFPPVMLTLALLAPAFGFALAASAARLVLQKRGPAFATLTFASMWTALDYLLSLGPDGTALSPAYVQVAAPVLIQASSLLGLWVVTFLVGLVSAGLAASFAKKQWRAALLALTAFAINAGFGAWRLSTANTSDTLSVGLIADDRSADAVFSDDPNVALATLAPYEEETRLLAQAGARLVVWPEKLAALTPDTVRIWRQRAQALSNETGAVIIMGVDERDEARHNRAYAFTPGGAEPFRYDKRHLVQGLESAFSVGDAPLSFAPGLGVAICKDMDFANTLRADAAAGAIEIMLVPAWDFEADGWQHARMAVMRGVENGFAVARSAKQGLLTLTDAHGRQIARARSSRGDVVMVSAALPRGPGPTLYTRIGDVFAWAAIAASIASVAMAFRRRRDA
jgi:apolipoprotein N-acyltransferase